MSPRAAQLVLALSAIGPAILATAFIAQADWATSLWPYETSRLTNIFIGSIFAAIALPTLWVAARREYASLRAAALLPGSMFAATAVYLFADGKPAEGLALGVGAAYAAVLVVLGSRVPLRDTGPMPMPVRISFGVFALVLVAAGALLVAGKDNILPWQVDDDSAVMAGFVFLGASTAYLYGVLRPAWGYAVAPLLGFLAYDAVLLGPLVDHFSDVVDEQRLSLVIYVAVLVYSALLGIYYLLVNAGTRIWGRPAAADSDSGGRWRSGTPPIHRRP